VQARTPPLPTSGWVQEPHCLLVLTFVSFSTTNANATNQGRVYVALSNDAPNALAVDSARHAFVAGKYITKFDTVGAIVFSKTNFPSFASGAIKAVTLTGAGDILFTGNASPQGAFPATKSFGTITSGSDAFVARLNSTGALVYSEVIHDAHMTPFAIARDSANEPFVTGRNSGYQYSVNRYSTAPSAGAFLLRGNSTGTGLWLDSTFGGDVGLAITVDPAWNAFVVGSVVSGEYFPLRSAYQTSFKGAAAQGLGDALGDLRASPSDTSGPLLVTWIMSCSASSVLSSPYSRTSVGLPAPPDIRPACRSGNHSRWALSAGGNTANTASRTHRLLDMSDGSSNARKDGSCARQKKS
jgi:hypothetical protein